MLAVAIQQSSQTGQPLTWKTDKIFHVLFTITPTNVNSGANANPYVAGGDTLDLTQLFNLASSAPGKVLPTFELPVKVHIKSFLGAVARQAQDNLYVYDYAPGTTLANGTMTIYTGAAAQTGLDELDNGNYPAGVLADIIQGEALFFVP